MAATSDDRLPSDMSSDTSACEEDCLALAMSCKDYGNIIFKECNFEEAIQKYTEGLKHLKDLESAEAVSLIVQLNSNSCICNIRLEQWRAAIQCADDVLKWESSNIKALYRRGLARRHLGELNAAKEDFLKVLSLEPNNVDVRKELIRIKDLVQKDKDDHRKAYSGLFQKASGLYDDREAEMKEKRLALENERRRQRSEYEQEMKQRKDAGDDEVEFDEWLKEKENNKKEKENPNQSQPFKTDSKEPNKPTKTNSSSKGTSIELDEEDEAIIKETKKMGYCYFRRELTDEERRLNQQNKPRKIEANMEHEGSAGDKAGTEQAEETARAISSWNSGATTYEEKDVTAWAKDKFADYLKNARVEMGKSSNTMDMMQACLKAMDALKEIKPDNMSALNSLMDQYYTTTVQVTNVLDVSGDAHIAVLRGTRRFLFDFKCTVKFDVTGTLSLPMELPQQNNDLDKGFKYNGTLVLPEVSSADGNGMSWLDGSSTSFSPSIRMEHRSNVDSAIQKLKESIVEQIQNFLEEYRRQ